MDHPIDAIEARADRAGVKINTALKEAGVAPSTWYRWKEKGIEPRYATIRKIHQALDQIGAAA